MIYDKVYNTIEKNALIPSGARVIAAVSGGADSVCLLDLLINLSDRLGIVVECAHLNHNLRGAESDGDEEYVRKLCKRFGIKLYVKSVDVASMSDGKSLEEVARNARYDFFSQLCSDKNTFVATAHTVNDNTETFFINLLRGSGSRGLCGIPIKRDKIIRPMLEVTRDEITEHLEKAGLEYRTDSTNADTDYLRNFIRHEVIPVFCKRDDINIFKSVSKVTDNLTKEHTVLYEIAKRYETDKVCELCQMSDAVLYRVINSMLEQQFGIILDRVHFRAVKDMLGSDGTRTQIKGDIFAKVENGCLKFSRQVKKDIQIYPLIIGENIVGEKQILIKTVKEVYKGLTKIYIDCDKIDGNLHARTRRDADEFYAVGRNGTSRLSKLLKNDKISTTERDRMLVICDSGENVVFVEGYGADRRYMPQKESKNIISIEIRNVPKGDKNGK